MKNIFNKKLFSDGMRQLRTIGIMGLIIFCLETVFIVIGNNMNNAEWIASYTAGRITISGSAAQTALNMPEVCTLLELHPILLAAIYILVPVMVLYLFGFMNRRNSSDFYHSIPVKRECIAVSFLAAIVTWLCIIVLVSTALCCILTLFTPYVAINMYSVLTTTLATLAGSVCMLAAGFLAMSITGTYFSNIAVSVMLLIFPRGLITFFTVMMSSLVQVLPLSLGGILDYNLNIVVGNVISLFIGGDALYPMTHLVPSLYTLVLAIVYFVIGMYAFKIRKSETATMPASNRHLQNIYRLIPPVCICLLPIAAICQLILRRHEMFGGTNAMNLFYIVLFYFIAVIAYFLYELISTRKIANVMKSFKSLWALVAFNVLFVIIIAAGYFYEIHNVPSADRVKYVIINTDDYSSLTRSDVEHDYYFTQKAASTKIYNQEIISKLVSYLEQNINDIKTADDADSVSAYSTRLSVEFGKGIGTLRRKVYVPLNEYQTFINTLNKSDDYTSIYKNLPEYNSLASCELYMTGHSSWKISDNDKRDLYEALCEDFRSLDLPAAISHTSRYSSGDCIGRFYVEVNYKSSTLNFYAGISADTPRALKLLVERINAASDASNAVNKLLDAQLPDGYAVRNCTLSFTLLYDGNLYDGSATRSFYTNLDGSNDSYADYTENGAEILNKIADRLDSAPATIDLNRPVLCVTYDSSLTDNNAKRTTESGCRFYQADDELVNLFSTFTKTDVR